jgi:hypothetical protein
MNQHLSITASCKAVPTFLKFPAQILEVIYFSIEDNPDSPILVRHGLLACRKIDDGQAAVPKQNTLSLIDAFTIRPAVGKGKGHFLNDSGIGARADYAANTAHQFNPFSIGFLNLA